MRTPWLGTLALMALAAVAAQPAHADVIDGIGKRLARLRSETETLSQGIRRPSAADQISRDRAERRLIDGQVAFGMGNYDDAAVMLFDYVEQHPTSPSFDEALYYLAEALFQKRDFLAARAYFARLVTTVGARSKFYQQSLERLIELSLRLNDSQDVDRWLGALDSVPSGKRRSSVPYVRGKYAYFKDRFDEAIGHFERVPASSRYHLQARYFIASAHVARGDLARAAQELEQLVKLPARTAAKKRVIELAHLALGRIYYERDQLTEAVDQYTRIDRASRLFDDALFEVSWVYVKNNQYDKALRALELLALSDPSSLRMPEVRILEGNLRIRNAQGMAGKSSGNSAEEHARATTIFQATHEAFRQPHDELARLIAGRADPRQFMGQITGRVSETFDVSATIPEVAAAWIREEPDMQRIIGIETDLGDIADEIAESERTIARLERALSSPLRANVFPSLADKRTRATEILEELYSIRQQLATHERALAARHASDAEKKELARLQERREAVARELAALPNSEVAYGKRIERARGDFDVIDQQAAEVATVIDASRATLIALERYLKDQSAGKKAGAAETQKAIDELRAELDGLDRELALLRHDTLLGKDEAGTGDEVAERGRELRAALRQALDDEHRAMARIAARMTGGDRARADKIIALTRTADDITAKLDRVHATVDEVVTAALAETLAALAEEKARLAAYKREFVQYEAESSVLGGVILGVSFAAVKEKFYDVLVRSDIGVIDVAWSQKEAADELARKLGFDRLRELRTLRDEFRDVLDEGAGQ